ncbi:MAG: serine hydrolase domain-containing protein, partial [Candidatus Sulfotelmatobacter sp.]
MTRRLIYTIAILLASARATSFAQKPPDFSAIDRLVNQAVDEHRLPGAVVIVGHHGHVVYRKAFGWRSLEPTREPMTLDTIFD